MSRATSDLPQHARDRHKRWANRVPLDNVCYRRPPIAAVRGPDARAAAFLCGIFFGCSTGQSKQPFTVKSSRRRAWIQAGKEDSRTPLCCTSSFLFLP